MADDRKGAVQAALDWITSHWGEIFTLWHVAGGNKAPDSAPDWVKAAETESVGGRGDPTDEATYVLVKSKIGTRPGKPRRVDAKGLEMYLDRVVNDVFGLGHPESWRRAQGHAAFEEWRVVITKMYQVDPQTAIDYVTNVAIMTARTFAGLVRATGKPLKSLNKSQKQRCWDATCEIIKHSLQTDGIPMPSGVKPYRVQLREAIGQLGPVKKEVLDLIRTKYPGIEAFAKDLAQDGWDLANEFGVKGWDWSKDRASAADAAMAARADRLRQDRQRKRRLVDYINPINLVR